ncbi:hypothetical protein [Lysobacter fragariae]
MEMGKFSMGLVLALATVLTTGMSIDPKRVPAPDAAKRQTTPTIPATETATATGEQSIFTPKDFAQYLTSVLKAETLKDPKERCLAYPELPGNEWPKEMVDRLCALVAPEGSLEELDTVLKQPGGGAELDRRYAALLEAHYANPMQKDRIFRAYDIFDTSPLAAAVAEEWVRQSPDSAYARTARAWQLIDSGWEARGGQFMRETPQDKVRRMDEFFGRSIPDLDFALKHNPKLLPACERLISVGASSSALAQRVGTELCLKADPASYRVMGSLVWATQPKWGGSQEEMRALVAMARAHEGDNPALAALRNAQAGYDAANDRAEGHFARSAPVLERAVLISPGYLQTTSRALINLKRSSDAFVYASQATRFDPRDGDAYYDRATALRRMGAYELAIEDAKRSRSLKKEHGWASLELARSLDVLQRYKEAREYAIEAMDDAETRGDGNEILCRSYWFTHELDKMAECTEKLVVDFPGNDEAWRLRAVAYKDSGNPKMYDAVDDFLGHADPKRQASEITWFKDWQAKHPRPRQAAKPQR